MGFPSPAADYMEPRIDLNNEFMPRPSSTFIIDCVGDSMINAFIPPKAKLIVDRSVMAKNGDIILAVVNGRFAVRFLKKNDHKGWLVPANSKYKETEITGEMNVEIWGVVTRIVIDPNDVKKCML